MNLWFKWFGLAILVPCALELARGPNAVVVASNSGPDIASDISFEGKESPKRLQDPLILKISQEAERQLASSAIKHYIIDYNTGSLILHFPHEYFPLHQSGLPENMARALVDGFSKYVGIFARDPELREGLKELNIVGFSSPHSEFVELAGKKHYNRELATRRARAVFQRLFNVSFHTFDFQDYALVRSTINGDGPAIMAKGKSMKEFCQINSCDSLNYVLIRPQLKTSNSLSREAP